MKRKEKQKGRKEGTEEEGRRITSQFNIIILLYKKRI